MSTNYYRLRPPITRLEFEKDEELNILKIWVNHLLSGEIALYEHETTGVLRLFVLKETDNQCPLCSYWGGDEQGTVVYVNEDNLPDEMSVISTYGELLTVAEVKARHGAKRKDGLPTELLGYED